MNVASKKSPYLDADASRRNKNSCPQGLSVAVTKNKKDAAGKCGCIFFVLLRYAFKRDGFAVGKSVAHRAEEFVIVGSAFHAVFDEFHRFD